MSFPAVKIEALQRTFENSGFALKDINLIINKGECVILKGISGSGKSTLLHIIGGLDRPTSGQILIENKPYIKLPDKQLSQFRQQHIAMIFQNFSLINYLSVEENIFAAIAPTSLHYKEMKKRIAEVLDLANISHKAQAIVSTLSGGERQRVAIARALINNPNIILCDEPTANLDKENSLHFIDILTQLYQMGKSIIVATHDPLFDNLPFSHKLVTIDNGTIIDECHTTR